MSKSKGNGVDPIDVIEKFGADALRFGLAYLTTETQDIRMPVEFECPHCQKLIEQTKENRVQPRVKCKHCGKEFSTQWAEKPDGQGPAAGGGGERAVRAGAELLQQALERLAVRPDEPGRLYARHGGRRRSAGRGPLDPQPPGDGHARDHGGPGRVSLCRRGEEFIRLRLGRVLQLLRGDGQGPAERRGRCGRRPSGCWPTRSTRSCGCCTR